MVSLVSNFIRLSKARSKLKQPSDKKCQTVVFYTLTKQKERSKSLSQISENYSNGSFHPYSYLKYLLLQHMNHFL